MREDVRVPVIFLDLSAGSMGAHLGKIHPAMYIYNLYALLQVNSGKERESQRLYSRKSGLFQKGVLGS